MKPRIMEVTSSPKVTQSSELGFEFIWSGSVDCQGFPGGSAGKEPACNAGDLDSIPGLGRSPGEGNGYPLRYSGLENSMNCIVHGVAGSRTGLCDFHFTSQHHLQSCSWVVFHVYMCHIFICSSFSGHLSCSHVLGIINSAPMNIGVRMSFWIIVF